MWAGKTVKTEPPHVCPKLPHKAVQDQVDSPGRELRPLSSSPYSTLLEDRETGQRLPKPCLECTQRLLGKIIPHHKQCERLQWSVRESATCKGCGGLREGMSRSGETWNCSSGPDTCSIPSTEEKNITEDCFLESSSL